MHSRAPSSRLCAAMLMAIATPALAEDHPATSGNGPIPNTNALSSKYLPAYSHFSDGLSWAGHLDSELFSNYSGGIRRGSEANMVGQLGLDYDTRKAGLWEGGQLTFSIMGIYSGGIQPDYSGDIQTASNIWAPPAVRIYDAAYRQKFTHWLNARIGITDINYYFDVTGNALQLVNSSFGITPTLTANVAGTATFPYPGLGAMISAHDAVWSSKVGIFQGDHQHRLSAFDRGYMALWEGGIHWDAKGDDDPDNDADDYGKYVLKIGAWRYKQPHPDLPGLSPSTAGVYAVAEGNWELPGNRDLGAFVQMGGAPQDFNPVPWYLGVGLRLGHPFPARRNDSLSIGMARAWLRSGPVANSLEVAPAAIHSAETAYEITYAAQLSEHVTLQPDLQYIHRPSGYYPDAIVGILRLHIEFF
ncbi:MAG: carbohydrate porin [Acidithiobacillus sp.]